MDTSRRASEWLFIGALSCYLAVVCGWLLMQPMPPLQDYLEWVYQGWIGAHLLLHDAQVSESFRFVRVPVPNELSQALLGLAGLVIGPVSAARIFIPGLLLGSAFLCWKAASRFNPGRCGALFLVLFLCFFGNTNFWNGYINYQLSIVLLLAFLLLQEQLNTMRVGLFGLAFFFCHASTFLAFVLLVAFTAAFDKRRRAWILGLAPGLLLMLWYVMGRQAPHAEKDLAMQLYSGAISHLEYKTYTLTKIGPFQNLIDKNSLSLKERSHFLYSAGIAVNVTFAGILALALAVAVRLRVRQRAWGKAVAPEYLASAVLLTGFLVLPSSTLGVVNLGERLLYPALLMIVFKLRGLPFAGVLASVALAGAALTSLELFSMPLERRCAPVAYTVDSTFSPAAKYQRFGLFSHELYVNDDRRYFLENPAGKALPGLRFDTSGIWQKPSGTHD